MHIIEVDDINYITVQQHHKLTVQQHHKPSLEKKVITQHQEYFVELCYKNNQLHIGIYDITKENLLFSTFSFVNGDYQFKDYVVKAIDMYEHTDYIRKKIFEQWDGKLL